jgi:5'-methylthioinosine phosphorylase
MDMERIGIIGGSGLARLESLEIQRRQVVLTPYGEPSASMTFGLLEERPVVFLPRHGSAHNIPPHAVNYRANIWAMQHVGIKRLVGIASVGGISQPPGAVVIPDQIIDYTWGREHTYVETDLNQVMHIDFTEPYCEELRQRLIQGAGNAGLEVSETGTYGATQGPRLETSMEIKRMQQDGCDLVGMTGMPEASLAREIGLCYASLAFVVNWAAGKSAGPITMQEIEKHQVAGIEKVRRVIGAV